MLEVGAGEQGCDPGTRTPTARRPAPPRTSRWLAPGAESLSGSGPGAGLGAGLGSGVAALDGTSSMATGGHSGSASGGAFQRAKVEQLLQVKAQRHRLPEQRQLPVGKDAGPRAEAPSKNQGGTGSTLKFKDLHQRTTSSLSLFPFLNSTIWIASSAP